MLVVTALALVSCFKDANLPPQEGVVPEEPEIEIPNNVVPMDYSATTFKIELTFKGTPTAIRFADLKYNKKGALSMDWDDGSNTSMDALTVFKALEIPDGTGKKIPWRAGVAVIGKSAYNDIELGLRSDLSNVSYEQMKTLIANGWDIQNHGLYSGFGGNFEVKTPAEEVEQLDKLILERIGYKLACTVVPGQEDGYVEAAAQFGHLAASSQRNDVGGIYAPVPEAEWRPLTDIKTWDPGFIYLTRSFTDTWELAGLQDKLTELVSTSDAKIHKLLRIGTHDSAPEGFKAFVTRADAAMGGSFLVCSMRELMEYEKLKKEAKLSVNGGTVTVQAPAGLRWEDFTLLVEGAEVLSVSCDQADEVRFSGNMINVYKDRL
ncbi:hypothetical protein GCM10027051_25330 [Niabella terrae]